MTTGAQRLVSSNFAALDGQRVGLIANQASLVGPDHVIDLFAAASVVDLVAIFAPEHGVRGKGAAGEELGDTVDLVTGVPILSLYGEFRQPTDEQLANIDVLVYDLQDAGARFYTYISTMGLAMQSAARTNTRFVVLDRPNPVGGVSADGFVLEEKFISFIGQYPVPSAYGLTPGELARAIVSEGWLEGLENLQLDVVELDGWTRNMLWPDTGLAWVPPSSGLASFESSLAYPGTVLFEATELSYGGGTDEPFYRFGAEWADGVRLAQELNAENLPGVVFWPSRFTPRTLARNTSDPRLAGEHLQGVRFEFTDPHQFQSVSTAIYVLAAFQRQAVELGIDNIIDRPEAFDLLAGTRSLRSQLESGASPEEIIGSWAEGNADYLEARRPYLLYE